MCIYVDVWRFSIFGYRDNSLGYFYQLVFNPTEMNTTCVVVVSFELMIYK